MQLEIVCEAKPVVLGSIGGISGLSQWGRILLSQPPEPPGAPRAPRAITRLPGSKTRPKANSSFILEIMEKSVEETPAESLGEMISTREGEGGVVGGGKKLVRDWTSNAAKKGAEWDQICN